MKHNFSCDYLVDITGLVDDGENLYSCCHPSGVMCGKEDCPVVIDFHKRCQKDTEASNYQTTMAENPSGTIDYDGLTRGKLCPLKAAQDPVTLLQNISPDKDTLTALAGGIVRVCAPGEPPRIEYIGGRCDGSYCAWWDANKERCAVLSLARNK